MTAPGIVPGIVPGIGGALGRGGPGATDGMHRHLLVSERLRLRRRRLGLTQREVVARLQALGVDTTNKALSSMEHGSGLDISRLPELARALECTLTWLVGLTVDPERWEPDDTSWPARSPEQRATTPAPPAPTAPASDVHDGPGTSGPWILGPLEGWVRPPVTARSRAPGSA